MPIPNINNLTAIDQQAHQACTSPLNDLPQPTDEQKESGDYQKGLVDLIGLSISIECPTGSNRSGVDPDGNEWSIEMTNHYGYINHTKGADGEEVDVFVKNGLIGFDGDVFVVHQTNPDGSFDEHKVIIGADTAEEARQIYLSNFDDDWTGLGKMVRYSIPSFKKKFLGRWGLTLSKVTIMTANNNKGTTVAAVKVDPERFTWMKYKGVKAKILTHTKRNGDVIKARLEPNDVFGYRQVKQRSTGKSLVQIVLKSDGMDLAYNLPPKSFNVHVLKVSRTTVLPKMFRKPVVIDTIDKNPKVKASEEAPLVKKPKLKNKEAKVKVVAPESKAPVTPSVSEVTEVKPKQDKAVDLGNLIANAINNKQLSKGIYSTFQAESGHLEVVDVDGIFVVSAVFNNTQYFEGGNKIADLEKALRDTSSTEFHSLMDAKSAATFAFQKANGDKFDPITDIKGLPNTVKRTINRSTGERRIRIPLFEIIDKEEAATAHDVDVGQIPVNEENDAATTEMVEDESISVEDLRSRLKESFGTIITDKNVESLQILANEYGVTVAELINDLTELAESNNRSLIRALNAFRQGHNAPERSRTESSVKVRTHKGLSFTVAARAAGVIRFKIGNEKADIPYMEWATALKEVTHCPTSPVDLEDYFNNGEVSELLETALNRLETFSGIKSGLLFKLAETDTLLQTYTYILGLLTEEGIREVLKKQPHLIDAVLSLKTR